MGEREDWERWNGELALRCDTLEARIERAKTILVEMDARDRRNGFLPIWWREKLDATFEALRPLSAQIQPTPTATEGEQTAPVGGTEAS